MEWGPHITSCGLICPICEMLYVYCSTRARNKKYSKLRKYEVRLKTHTTTQRGMDDELHNCAVVCFLFTDSFVQSPHRRALYTATEAQPAAVGTTVFVIELDFYSSHSLEVATFPLFRQRT